MKFRLGLLVLAVALMLQGQVQMNVQQLVEFLRSELALKQQSDKQIAAYLKKVQLTEKLTDKTIIDLEAQGAGPRTVEALQELRDRTSSLKPPTQDATYSPATTPDTTAPGQGSVVLRPKVTIPPPDSVRQQQILGEIKQYAMTYTENLPNFMCLQVTRRFVDFNQSDHFRITDTVNAQLRYGDGKEDYKVISVNNRTVDLKMEQLGGAVSVGEFGSLMKGIFDSKSEAEFGWDHWATLRGKRMAVFNYFIDSGHSSYSIDYNREQRIITAYKGLVYADEYTGAISRITFVAVDIPKSFPVNEASEILDYDDIDISGQKYVCPLKADLRMRAGREKTKNEIEFRLYRKFGTESNIVYGAEAPAPLSDIQTQEQPANAAPGTPASKSAAPAQSKSTSTSDPWRLPTPPPPPPQ
ncbi:MAG: hypothetical protein JOY62_18585 [Acidobacteriaceae bacterium]|nr:hypothetical protein [Acidobacteriaceae bacterium]MBV9781975.1 hypothetical protein [Acidobacteriaceae bacterium]